MSIYVKYEGLLAQKKEIDKEILETQIAMYEKHAEKANAVDSGTVSIEDDGYSLKIVKKESVSIDQTLASVVGVGFKKKFELDKKAYKVLSIEDQKRVDECLTTKPSKPTFKLERL